ncbi:hypothetical protein V5N11_035692 [Cardamine amara subsp. amara]|uniref:Uncharacterized protein n=1 Tax=Cardamine amara subsp. amara TaxID=228776 RepID=A0ABD0ZM47_CARAN
MFCVYCVNIDYEDENNGVVIPVDHNLDEVEKLDKSAQDLKDVVQKSAPVPDEQQGYEDHDQEMLHPVHNPAKDL